MTKLRYVGTYAQEFPGPDDTRVTYAPGEFLEDADTENDEIKAGLERGELLDPGNTEAPAGFVSENNVPDGEAQAQGTTATAKAPPLPGRSDTKS